MQDSSQPTLEDVAKVAGVSRATVSRVINDIRNVDPELQETVRSAIDKTGYVPNHAARSLVTKRTGSVALVVSEAEHRTFDDPFLGRVFTDPFFGRLLSGVFGELRPRQVNLVLMLTETDAARARLVDYLRRGHVDGVILVSTHAEDPLPRLLTQSDLPAVLSRRPSSPLPISHVDADQRAGAALAAEHLVARGCKRVATISGPMDMPAGRERLDGFRTAMALRGYPDVPSVEGNFTQDSGRLAAEELLARHGDIDGLFAANDLMAQGALLALHDRGLRVPEQVAVVGFDDSSAAVVSRPRLTTVRQPIEEMAAELARLLLARIEDRGRPVGSRIFEPTLVIRDSA
jgi:DNA-binding LacI/PurR family transcriptional regulator